MLSQDYENAFERMLWEVGLAASDKDARLAPFWPVRGAGYDGGLLVIGRSVNAWVADWAAEQLLQPTVRRSAVETIRSDAEPQNGCRMQWVTDHWGARGKYNTRRSAFWRVLRSIVLRDPTLEAASDRWPSQLVWTNLYKVSPAGGWNPGAAMQRAQREHAIELLKWEVEEYRPRRVLALTGDWMDPFVNGLGLTLDARTGLVRGLGTHGSCAWVVAEHPMKKPESRLVSEVLAAFADLGAPFV